MDTGEIPDLQHWTTTIKPHYSLSTTNLIFASDINFITTLKVRWNFTYTLFSCNFATFTIASTKIILELKKNILNCGCGINYKYEDMLAHSFDRFYVVTIFILPNIRDLNFSKLNYDNTCAYLDNKNVQILKQSNKC